MLDPKRIGAAFSRAAKRYDEHATLQHLVRQEAIAWGESAWAADARLLDIGGGTGAFARDIHRLGLNWRITHLDLSPGMCQEAHLHNPFVVNADATTLPFAEASFDGIFSSLMLQWLDDPLPALREMRRVLRQEGRCVLATFTRGTLDELRQSFAALDNAPHINHFADPATLTAQIVHIGFRLLACEEETYTAHYPDATALMRSIKTIGASVKQGRGQEGLTTPRRLKRLNDIYSERFGDKRGLPATWQVLYMLLEKAAP